MNKNKLRIIKEEAKTLEAINDAIKTYRYAIKARKIRMQYRKKLIKSPEISRISKQGLKSGVKHDKQQIRALRRAIKEMNMEAAPLRLAKALGLSKVNIL